MRKHAASLRPKFEMITDMFDKELGGLGVGTWYKPKGGYFITYETLERADLTTAAQIFVVCQTGKY